MEKDHERKNSEKPNAIKSTSTGGNPHNLLTKATGPVHKSESRKGSPKTNEIQLIEKTKLWILMVILEEIDGMKDYRRSGLLL